MESKKKGYEKQLKMVTNTPISTSPNAKIGKSTNEIIKSVTTNISEKIQSEKPFIKPFTDLISIETSIKPSTYTSVKPPSDLISIETSIKPSSDTLVKVEKKKKGKSKSSQKAKSTGNKSKAITQKKPDAFSNIKEETDKKSIASKKISKFMRSKKSKAITQKKTDAFSNTKEETDTKSIASKKISKFMRINKKKSRSRYIKRFCSDPGLCIAFDISTRQKINEHFDFFSSLHYISDDIKQIGKKSANGFIKEVKFTHDDYSAYAVLKSSKSNDTYTTDNLVYEYIAGQYINHQCNYLPCFVETYGLFYYKDDSTWKLFEEQTTTTPQNFIDGLELQTSTDIDYAKACKQSQYAAILTQYIHGAQLLHSFIRNTLDYSSYQMIYQMPYILYQVYFALAQIKHNFTHYDLHTSNVMLYLPEKGKYIEYIYHLSDNKEVRFKCPYLVKIIDYGRCFFKWDPIDIDKNKDIDRKNKERNPVLSEKEKIYTSSPDIYKYLCDEEECKYVETDQEGKTHEYTCGKKFGFSWLDNPRKKTTRKYFISSSRSNVSHDLRLLYIVGQALLHDKAHEFNEANRKPDEIKVSKEINELFKKIVYAVGLKADDNHSGTKENKSSGLPSRIQNVLDAEKALRELLISRPFIKLNNFKYSDKAKRMGTLHIYTDGTQMKFDK